MRISDWSSDVCSSDLGLKMPLDKLDFANPGVTAGFADYLHGFHWLRDLATVATREQAAPIAEGVMRKWLAAHADTPSEPAWRADNAGWRQIRRTGCGERR